MLLRVNVAPDGSVSSADRMGSDPQLAESAIAAAKQWKYEPFVNCGKPVEGQAVERVKYSLSDPASSVEVVKRSDAVRISSRVAAGLVVSKVNPQYPPEAAKAGIQGMVVLLIKIGKDGHPHDVQFVSGVPQLADAAIEAVKQWQYKPYLLNGQPTEVETTVQVNSRCIVDKGFRIPATGFRLSDSRKPSAECRWPLFLLLLLAGSW